MGSRVLWLTGGIPRWLVLAIAMMAMFLMPVDYRAGANQPHPHAMLQLLYEASQGIPLHHHAVDYDRNGPDRAANGHTSMSTSLDMAAGRSDIADNGQLQATGDLAQQPDVSLSVLVQLLSALVPGLLAMLALAHRHLDRPRRDLQVLAGVAVTPEPPPPQVWPIGRTIHIIGIESTILPGCRDWGYTVMRRMLKVVFSVGAIMLLTSVFAITVNAHEQREVADGQFNLTVGFLEEPAFVNEKNGLSLRVVTTDEGDAEGEPVEGLFGSLEAEVIYGDQSMELELTPTFGDPGHYESIFFPAATGSYTFHIFGEIEGNDIDESFTSGPETFSEVEPIEPLQFPKESSQAGLIAGFPVELGALGLALAGAGYLIRRQQRASSAH